MSAGLFGPDRAAERIPVSVITGFLGSGKTTLLNHLLRQPAMADSAVIVNELGEIGLDHFLVERIDGETVLLQSGCVCCTVRSDLETSLRGLLGKVRRGDLAPFARVLIETTGVADPAPICQLLLNNPLLTHWFGLDTVVTTVDAVHGVRQLADRPEARKQAALADRLLLTKLDLAAADSVAALEGRLTALNPTATRHPVHHGVVAADGLFGAWAADPIGRLAETAERLDHDPQHHAHGDGVVAFAFTFAEPLAWPHVQRWLAALRARHGESLLRVKGILALEDVPVPVVIHGVHHVFHPPVRLAAWPDGDRRSRLVLITDGLERGTIEALWAESAGAAEGAPPGAVRRPGPP